MSALLPCPFCGAKAHIEDGRNDRPWLVQCQNSDCYAQPFMDHADTRKQAIAAWNTRKGHKGSKDLRDYFAGQALAGVDKTPQWSGTEAELARRMYCIADAMLAERSKP